MAFPIDERVSCAVMRNNPLVNGESHFLPCINTQRPSLDFTYGYSAEIMQHAARHLQCLFLVVHGLGIVIVIFTVQTVRMACTKQTKWRSESKGPRVPRQPFKWGTAASGVTHRPPVLPARAGTSGNPSYKGMA